MAGKHPWIPGIKGAKESLALSASAQNRGELRVQHPPPSQPPGRVLNVDAPCHPHFPQGEGREGPP